MFNMSRDKDKLDKLSKQAHAHSVFVRLVLPPYTIHFKSPTYLQPSTLDLLDKKVCKETLKNTAHDSRVREAIGLDANFWSELVGLLRAAVPSLERRSFQNWDPSSVDYESTSGALIAGHYPALWRDLERLNDLVSISRNCLTIGGDAQDFAADYGVDPEIFRLVNCCVRVTARGYDGEAGTGEEEKWQWVVNAYKKLLITSLQFLNNLVAQNEKSKLTLWLSLFDNTSEYGFGEDGSGHAVQNVSEPQPPKKPTPPIGSSDVLLAYGSKGPSQRLSPLEYEAALPLYEDEGFKPLPANAAAAKKHGEPNGYVYFTHIYKDRCIDDFLAVHKRSPTLAEIHRNIPRYWHEAAAHNSRLWSEWQERFEGAVTMYRHIEEDYQDYVADPQAWRERAIQEMEEESAEASPSPPKKSATPDQSIDSKAVEEKIKALEGELAERYRSDFVPVPGTEVDAAAAGLPNPLDPRSADEKNDMRMLFTAEAGTKILESGKAELMKRLEGYSHHPETSGEGSRGDVEGMPDVPLPHLTGERRILPSGPRRRSDYAVEEAFAEDSLDEDEEDESDEEGSEDEDDDEEDYPGSTEDGRGLLTDVPLILGPSEIEVLPMLIMSGLVVPPAETTPTRSSNGRTKMENSMATDVANGSTLRTHLLLSQTAGRNLLRELLIFVAAWDLREEELYFKFMVRILEAILKNGLMPYAYHAFRDRSRSKDIISPAQAVIMKLLTCVFRQRNENARKEARGEVFEGQTSNTQQSSNMGRNNDISEERAKEMKRREDEERRTKLINKPSQVDLHILNFIFTEFRQHIIPQTCALIFLQGQIHKGRASPEDFPLNLWDMERMYEGVYQYLEFFAVLTEEQTTAAASATSEEKERLGVKDEDLWSWKRILADWEMASELVTLLRELEGGIPKLSAVPPPPPAPTAEQKRTADGGVVGQQAQQGSVQRSLSADAAIGKDASQAQPVAVERPFDVDGAGGANLPPLPLHPEQSQQMFEAETPLAYPEDGVPGGPLGAHDLQQDQDEPSDFEWRNLKKLTVLVLSSLIWKNKQVQDQVRQCGGLEALIGCCRPDEHNPYIREHAIMCLRFAVEGNEDNANVIRRMASEKGGPVGRRRKQAPNTQEAQKPPQQPQKLPAPEAGRENSADDVPKEVLDTHGYETFMDSKGQVGLRRKDGAANLPPASAPSTIAHDSAFTTHSSAAAALSSALSSATAQLPNLGALTSGGPARVTGSAKAKISASEATKLTAEKAAELMQNALRDLPVGNELVTDKQKAEALARLDRAFESTEKALGKDDGGGNGKKG